MKQILPKILGALTCALPVLFQSNVSAQGCVAVRGGGMCSLHLGEEGADVEANPWLASVAYRYLHSFRHFVGDVEQVQRAVAGNQVINHSHFIDFGMQYRIGSHWDVAVTLPFVTSTRSQIGGTPSVRFETQASGIGDARLTGYYWIFDPKANPRGNIQLGLGLKAPTGDDNVQGTFLGTTASSVHAVDQSIQPGDGGWGVALEVNAFRQILPRTVAFIQASYLLNPEDTNDTVTGRYRNDPNRAGYYENLMSIPDQYFARGGFGYTVVPKWGLTVSLAGRLEGIPVEDILGSSNGFRRPGFGVSIDPGIQVAHGRYTFNINVPFALYRNRERSVADQLASAASGTEVHGDAAFADYVVTAAFAVRF